MSRPPDPSKPDPVEAFRHAFSLPRGAIVEEVRIRSPENKEDRKHRLQMESRSFWIKEAPAYLVALILLLGTAAYCFWTLFHPTLPAEDRQWAKSILGGLMSGIVGYLFGKATK